MQEWSVGLRAYEWCHFDWSWSIAFSNDVLYILYMKQIESNFCQILLKNIIQCDWFVDENFCLLPGRMSPTIMDNPPSILKKHATEYFPYT